MQNFLTFGAKPRAYATKLAFAALAVGFASMAVSEAVLATTLNSALARAYRNNPVIAAARARLRATDENVAIARSGFRPTVSGSVTAAVEDTRTDPPLATDGTTRPRSYSVTASQNLFNGFQDVNAEKAARAEVNAEQENLRRVEQTLFIDGVTAFLDVIRDRALVRLQQNNLGFLNRQLQATRDRFKVGEVTRTDVAQARAAVAESRSDLDTARANLRSSRGNFQRVFGFLPGRLVKPQAVVSKLPRSLNEAISISQAENPDVVTNAFLEEAARYDVRTQKGRLLPTLDLEANYTKVVGSSQFTNSNESASLTGRLNVPLYQRGEVMARIRQAKEVETQRVQETSDSRIRARDAVVDSWSTYTASRARLRSDREQVQAQRIALDGVREEEKVGQRTILDVLEEEQRLLDAQVRLVTTERDIVVASYSVLNAIGRLTASDLNLATELYDKQKHLRKVERKFWGYKIERNPDFEGGKSHGERHRGTSYK